MTFEQAFAVAALVVEASRADELAGEKADTKAKAKAESQAKTLKSRKTHPAAAPAGAAGLTLLSHAICIYMLSEPCHMHIHAVAPGNGNTDLTASPHPNPNLGPCNWRMAPTPTTDPCS